MIQLEKSQFQKSTKMHSKWFKIICIGLKRIINCFKSSFTVELTFMNMNIQESDFETLPFYE